MEHLQLERDGRVLIATMARGKANALNAEFVDELNGLVSQVREDETVGALVIASANPRLFSAGLDFGEVFAYDDERMTRFFERFVQMLDDLRGVPKGVVAAVAGHAIAGGALIALACDFRILAEGDFGFALNEVDLGLVLPAEAARWLVPPLGPAAREVLLGGLPISPQRALMVGLATAVVPPEQVRERAVALARELSEKPPHAFAAIKAAVNDATGGLPGSDTRRGFVDEFMRFWTGAESRQRRAALAASLKR